MADVVQLQEWLERTPRRETIRREVPAQILLFTGVRYERLAPPASAVESKVAKRRRSDTARRP